MKTIAILLLALTVCSSCAMTPRQTKQTQQIVRDLPYYFMYAALIGMAVETVEN